MLSCPAPWSLFSVLVEAAPDVVSTTDVPSQVRFVPAIAVKVNERWLIQDRHLVGISPPVSILSN